MELLHPGATCNSLDSSSPLQPDLSSYSTTPQHVTGASFSTLVERVLDNITFDALRVVPTGGAFTDTNEYQLRFNPYDDSGNYVNPTMTRLYNDLVNEFLDVQVLDVTDPFHMSMCRETSFCTADSRTAFFNMTESLTIQPWKTWAQNQSGVILNEDIPRYSSAGAGGFYLFITRNRPIIYFAPGGRGSPTSAYYVKWEQDGENITWANPTGGSITETLLQITSSMSTFYNDHPELKQMVNSLCNDYSYNTLPTSVWSPLELFFVFQSRVFQRSWCPWAHVMSSPLFGC